MIRTYLKTEDFCAPKDGTYFLLAANGLFVSRNTDLFTAIGRARPTSGLEIQEPSLRLKFRKLPRAIMEQAYGFFDWAWRRWRSEAILFLYYSPSDETFALDAPHQTIYLRWRAGRPRAEGRITYRSLPRPPGFVKLGDLHSHGSLPAFFSCQDDRDDCEEGLKVVLGRLDRAVPETQVSFVAARCRFPLRAQDAVEEFTRPVPPPADWIQRFHCEDSHEDEDA